MFTQVKMYIAGATLIVILGLIATIWVLGERIDKLKAEISQLRLDKTICLAANVENDKTVKALTAERDKVGNTCDQRIKAKDDLIKKLQAIDNISGGNNEQNGGVIVAGSGTGNPDGDNALLSALNGMLPGQGGGEDGVHSSGGAESAGRTSVLSGDLGYCVDEVNAKNVLKNTVLLQSWALDMQTILVSLQSITASD